MRGQRINSLLDLFSRSLILKGAIGASDAASRPAEAFYMCRMFALNQHPVNKGQEAGSA